MENQILEDPTLFDLITLKEFDKKIAGEFKARKVIFLISCATLVKNFPSYSMNLLVNSESNAGKSYITKKILDIWGEKRLVYKTKITPQVFTYWHNSKFEPDWDWNGKLLYLEDIDENVINHPTFKVMCSEGSESTVVIKQMAIEIQIKGKPIMFVTTADTSPNNEILNRFLIINLDESKEQTKKILRKRAQIMQTGKSEEYNQDILKALEKLEEVKIRIPHAEFLVDFFPDDNLRMRREFDRFLGLICASCALHQFQRERDQEGYLIPCLQDVLLAREVFSYLIESATFFGLTHRMRKAYDLAKTYCERGKELSEAMGLTLEPNDGFSVQEIHAFAPSYSERQWYRVLDRLSFLGILKAGLRTNEKGRKTTIYNINPITQGLDDFMPLLTLSNKFNIDMIDINASNDTLTYLTYLRRNLYELFGEKDEKGQLLSVQNLAITSNLSMRCPSCELSVHKLEVDQWWNKELSCCKFCAPAKEVRIN